MDQIIEEWIHAREMQRQWEQRVDQYRKQAEDMMSRQGIDVYETATHRLKRQSQQREVMSKKMVPPEIWSKYALPQRVEFLVLSSKIDSGKKKFFKNKRDGSAKVETLSAV